MSTWQNFTEFLVASTIEFEDLKVVQLAQAILESGRGKSDLFTLHINPYGMKFRREMRSIADQVIYTDSAGETDIYCKFDNYKEQMA
jgi:N-acetylmuramoyl-L-alanine amidase